MIYQLVVVETQAVRCIYDIEAESFEEAVAMADIGETLGSYTVAGFDVIGREVVGLAETPL